MRCAGLRPPTRRPNGRSRRSTEKIWDRPTHRGRRAPQLNTRIRLRVFALNLSDQPDDHWPDARDMAEDPGGHVVDIGDKTADHVHGRLHADLLDVCVQLAFGVLILTEVGTDLLTHQLIDRADRLAWRQRE